MLEEILTDLYNSDNEWNIVLLRYQSHWHMCLVIQVNPKKFLQPFTLYPQVVVGKLERVGVFEMIMTLKTALEFELYSCVDLAKGHVAAFGLSIYNLGTGKGYSF